MGMVVKALTIEQTDEQVIEDRHGSANRMTGHGALVFLKSNIAAVV